MGRFKMVFFLLKDQSFKKVFNIFKVRLSLALGFSKVWGYPYNILIEPTNICNLSCPVCPTGSGASKRKKGNMSFEEYKKIMGELGNYLLSVYLTNYGEPFLNKEIFDMIGYNKSRGIKTVIATNGHYLDEKNVKKILDSGLDDISVALDGVDQDTLIKYRKNASFKTVYEGIKLLVSERDRLNKDLKIHLQFIVMKHNENQLNEIRRMSKSFGVDSLYIKTIWVDGIKHANQFLPQSHRYSRYIIKDGKLIWKESDKKGCSKLWTESVINWNGNVVPCCYDFYEDLVLGNVFKDNFKNIWNNEKYVQLRKSVLFNKSNMILCRDCPGKAELSFEEK